MAKKKSKVVAKKAVSKKPKTTTKKVAVKKKTTEKPIRKKAVVSKVAVEKKQAVVVTPTPVKETLSLGLGPTGLISPYDDKKYDEYLSHIDHLRLNGENKVNALRDEIRDIKLNKQIEPETKKTLIAENKKQLKNAKEVAKNNRKAVRSIISSAGKSSKKEFREFFASVKKKQREEIANARHFYHEMVANFKKAHKAKMAELKAHKDENREEYKINIKTEKIAYAARLSEAKTARNESIDLAKQYKYNSFMRKYNYSSKLRNDKHPIGEWLQYKKEHYVANFNISNWLLKNALYIIIIAIFVGLVIVSNGSILTGSSILEALVQIAPKIFFALGVAGLILLGGTDLSIGRLTGIGVSFSLMLLASQTYTDNNGAIWFNVVGAPGAVKVICAILVSITFCTFFTAFAGFFTAKFKMHPFISTLAVQLISFGFFQLFWSGVSSFTADSDPGTTVDLLRGPNGAWLIIYAAVAVLIIWFIWNKTKFGKNMYAVGGNQEAAVVSGINPFTVTLCAFIMAGILYGLGGFVQALQVPAGNFNSGYGTETDAIAACVIGGISFSGGVGKVRGAVIGAIVLGFLTYAFNFLSINANLQLLIKGVIILVAVALDCVKYLRKK